MYCRIQRDACQITDHEKVVLGKREQKVKDRYPIRNPAREAVRPLNTQETNAYDWYQKQGSCYGEAKRTVYTTTDPRTCDPRRHIRSTFSEVPKNSLTLLKNIPHLNIPETSNYGNATGDYTYYVGGKRSVPYYIPLFNHTTVERSDDYVDPMGSAKPEYVPKQEKHCGMSSFINHTNDHRESILASRFAKINQERYQLRH